MKTRLRAFFVIATTIAGNSAWAIAGGGNHLINPNFDSDLAGWLESSSQATWTSTQDHHAAGSMGAGAASVSAPSNSQFITQCVHVDGSSRYVATVWAKSQCGHAAELDLFWGDADCNISLDETVASTSHANVWQQLIVTATAPSTRDPTAVVVLHNTGECHDVAFFDDAFLTEDAVFRNGFEEGK